MLRTDCIRAGVRNVSEGTGIDKFLAYGILAEVSAAIPLITCTRHPLGFAHAELTALVGGSFRTRLHLWTRETSAWADDLGNLHDHTWELRSAVLTGALVDTYLEPRQDPAGLFRAQQILYGEVVNRTVRMGGSWSLDEMDRRRVQQGEYYELQPRAVHVTSVESLPTATLVVAKDHGGPGPRVFLPVDADNVPAGDRQELDSSWMIQALQEATLSLS